MKRWNIAMICAATMGVSGCGGGDGSTPSSSSTPVMTSQPSTPLTTPSTPSTIPYQTASDFTHDRSFTAIGTTTVLIYAPDGNGNDYSYTAALDGESDAIGFDYVAATQTYHARYLSDTIDAATTHKIAASVAYDEYVGPQSGLEVGAYFARSTLGVQLNYVGLIFWAVPQPQPRQTGAMIRSHRLLFGIRSLAADLPQSGVSSYSTQNVELSQMENRVNAFGSSGIRFISANLTIDWLTHVLSGQVIASPPSGTGSSLRSPDYYTVTGAADADGHLTGTISGAGYVGTLQGNVYGPRGGEIGFLFTYGGTFGGRHVEYVGTVVAGSQ